MRQSESIQPNSAAGKFNDVKPKKRSYQQKCWIAECIGFKREMCDHICCVPYVENAECECGKQYRKKRVGSGPPATFTIDQDDYKNTQYNPTIDENKE